MRTLHQGRDWILRIQTWRKTCSFWEIHLIRPSGLTSQSIKTYVGHLGRLCKPRVLGNERNHRCNLTVRSKTDARLQGVNAMTGDREEAFVPCFICRQVQAFDRSQRLVLLESKKFPQCKVPRKVRVFRVLLGRHGNEVHMNMHFVDGSAGLSYASPRYLDLRPSLVPGTIAFSATSTEATTPKEMQLGRTFRRNFLQHEGQAGTESKSTQGIRMSKHAVRCFVLLRGSARARAPRRTQNVAHKGARARGPTKQRAQKQRPTLSMHAIRTCRVRANPLIRPRSLTSQAIKNLVRHLGRKCMPSQLGNAKTLRCNLIEHSKTDVRLRGSS